ncbi:MAG: hypothetical protein H7328_09400 [Bdellovibrio sp.]|nr:hypothetical protein [Bdellovibrio sp.]
MKLTINKTKPSMLRSNSGFIIADFLFSFVLVIGIGMIIFALTFSLAMVEVAQYIVWSSARNFAAANTTEWSGSLQAGTKFKNLSSQFPLLTDSNLFSLPFNTFRAGDLAKVDSDFAGKIPGGDIGNSDPTGEQRQPWIGASAKINLKMFNGLQIPFLGKASDKPIEFPIRAFVIRSPSKEDCTNFYKYENRFVKGIKAIADFAEMNSNLLNPPTDEATAYAVQEDNGC